MSEPNASNPTAPLSGHRPRDERDVDLKDVSELLDLVDALTSGDFTVAVDERDSDFKDVEL